MKDCFLAETVEENNENTSLARKKTIPQDNIVASSSAAPPPQQIYAQRGNQNHQETLGIRAETTSRIRQMFKKM